MKELGHENHQENVRYQILIKLNLTCCEIFLDVKIFKFRHDDRRLPPFVVELLAIYYRATDFL